MLIKLSAFIDRHQLLQPGEKVTCAVSGGADSVALLFALYLLRDKLGIELAAAHFNHHLRGEESDRDAAFVRALCDRYDIPLHMGGGEVVAGRKGLEAAARDARYAFFATLPGKIATAHTADDNAETVLMHMVRGTGLRGLGGIAPARGQLIRPMLDITRQEVLGFLEEYHLQYVEDSSNQTDRFLRNRLRHCVMPLLREENPNLARNLSAMALRLREDEKTLSAMAPVTGDVEQLRQMPPALRSRSIDSFLHSCGVAEPESQHIRLVEKLVFSDQPSGSVALPGGVTVGRCYGKLQRVEAAAALDAVVLQCPGQVMAGAYRITCEPATELSCDADRFTVYPRGEIQVRSRCTGDAIRLPGGTKTLKKLFIDKKIPADRRLQIPVVADAAGILGVCGVGPDRNRLADSLPAVQIRFEVINNKGEDSK